MIILTQDGPTPSQRAKDQEMEGGEAVGRLSPTLFAELPRGFVWLQPEQSFGPPPPNETGLKGPSYGQGDSSTAGRGKIRPK